MIGKTIRIFLADGEPTGILLAEISNWTGKVLVAPRSQLDQLSKREEARRTGVYLLAGPDPDDPSRALAYIGEGDNVLKRLLRRSWNEAKDFWERTVMTAPPADAGIANSNSLTSTPGTHAHVLPDIQQAARIMEWLAQRQTLEAPLVRSKASSRRAQWCSFVVAPASSERQ